MKSGLANEQITEFCDAPTEEEGGSREAIADTLEALATKLRTFSGDTVAATPTQSMLLALAAKVHSARRRIDTIFEIPGFAVSPAWDIMLDLYQAKVLGKRISITSACIGGACAPTTGLRWLQVLESDRLVDRAPDPEDRRRSVVELTDGGKIKVERALTSLY